MSDALKLSATAPLTVVQITDTHLGEQRGERLTGVDTDDSLQDVLSLIASREQQVDVVLATGDIVNQPSISGYRRFIAYMNELDCPWLWLPGNHDSPELMRELAPDNDWERGVDSAHWQCQLLNTHVPGQVGGGLAGSELQRLEQSLGGSDKHQLVFLHHQPIPVGSRWIDSQQVSNGDELERLLGGYPRVKAVVWGHVHQDFYVRRGHIDYRATPSTCIQFAQNSLNFALDSNLPGYRRFTLHADGSYTTTVERVEAKDYGLNLRSQGY